MFDPRAATTGNFGNRTTSIIPQSEIRRIRNSCCEIQDNHTLIDKLDLHAKSQERIKKWPCAMNIRRRKNESQFERFRQDEEERRRIEKEEQEHQIKTRQETLEKANKQIFENNPQIRKFQQKLLLTDVLCERDSQLQINDYKRTINKIQDQMHYDQMLENIAKLEDTENKKLQEQQRKKNEQKQILKQQQDEFVNNHIKQLITDQIEGQLTKAKAEKMIYDEEMAEKERKRKRLENLLEIRKGNEQIKEFKLQQIQKEKEEDELIRLHGEKKERISQMRKQREELKFKEKQDQRQKLIDAQVALLMKKESEQLNLMDKQIKEVEKKDEEAERQKEIKHEKMRKQIEESRQLIKEAKQNEQQLKEQNDKEFQQYWKQRGEELKKIEKDEIENVRRRNISVKDYQLQQIEQKQKLREQQILQDIEQAEELKRLKEVEKRTFSSWAERAVKEWADQGKNIRPLLKELATCQDL